MSKHTPEPWYVVEIPGDAESQEPDNICIGRYDEEDDADAIAYMRDAGEESRACAKRLVASVNALASLNPAALAEVLAKGDKVCEWPLDVSYQDVIALRNALAALRAGEKPDACRLCKGSRMVAVKYDACPECQPVKGKR